MRIHDVVAEWDDEARVWVATSDDIPGHQGARGQRGS